MLHMNIRIYLAKNQIYILNIYFCTLKSIVNDSNIFDTGLLSGRIIFQHNITHCVLIVFHRALLICLERLYPMFKQGEKIKWHGREGI